MNRDPRVVPTLAALLLFMEIPTALLAQSQALHATIDGVVMDSTGAVASAVEVSLKHIETGMARRVVTNQVGLYSAPLLPTGHYDLTFTKNGFKTVQISGLLLQIGETRSINMTLNVSDAAPQTITVDGDTVPLIETSRSTFTTNVDSREIHSFPALGRSFFEFIQLAPASFPSTLNQQDTYYSVGGQKGQYTSFNVDGAAFNSSFFGNQTGGNRPPFIISLEAIQEFVVTSNGQDPEFGRSGGGMLNAITKSGTNDFHGNAFWFFQDHSFVRTDAFGVEPLGRRQQFGGSAGGPVKRNRLFFFAAADNQKLSSPINLEFDGQSVLQEAKNSTDANRRAAAMALLQAQGRIFMRNNSVTAFGKVDWSMSDRRRLSIQYSTAHNDQPNGTFGPLRQRAASPDNFGRDKDTVDMVNIQFTSLTTATSMNEVRAHFTRENRPRLDNPVPGTTPANGIENGASVSISGIGDLGALAFMPIVSREYRYQITDNYTQNFGRHVFKTGVDFNYVQFTDGFRGGARGLFTFYNFDNFVARRPDEFTEFFGSGTVTTPTVLAAAFFQDSLRLRPNLTLNWGLRWDAQINAQGDLPNADFYEATKHIPNDARQWSPRLGIAWSPGDTGRQVIRAHTSYLRPSTATWQWFNVLRNNGDVTNGVSFVALRSSNPDLLPPFPYPYIGPYQTPYSSYPGAYGQAKGTVPGSTVTLADPAFHNARVFRANAGYERQIGRDLTIGITYDYAYTTGNERYHDHNLFAASAQPVTGRMIYNLTDRPYPLAGQVLGIESTASSRYSAMILSARKRVSGRLEFLAYYTYGQNRADDENEALLEVQGYDQRNYRLDWGPSNLDIRHQVVFSGLLQLPHGIGLSPILHASSGRPFNAITGTDDPNDYTLSTAALQNFRNYLGDQGATVYGGGNGDGNANSDRPIINGSVLPRNYFRQPSTFQTNIRLSKVIRLTERQSLQLIGDVFNIFNNSNKFTTNTVVMVPSFGVLNNASEPLSFQAGLRYQW